MRSIRKIFEERAADKCGDQRCPPGSPHCSCQAFADDVADFRRQAREDDRYVHAFQEREF